MWEKGREQRILWDEWLHALRPGERREPGAHREWLVAQYGWNGKFEGVSEDVRLETYVALDQHRSWRPNFQGFGPHPRESKTSLECFRQLCEKVKVRIDRSVVFDAAIPWTVTY